jgi:hypothetical protein
MVTRRRSRPKEKNPNTKPIHVSNLNGSIVVGSLGRPLGEVVILRDDSAGVGRVLSSFDDVKS